MSEAPRDQRTWDVLIAGAGPSGSRLAQQLSAAGATVLLVEALEDFSKNAFSSAALPLSAVERWQLPESVIASRWDQWQLFGPGESRRCWAADAPLGVVLDFAALRRWLADQALASGTQLQLGWRVCATETLSSGLAQTQLRGPGGREEVITSRFVVDATGEKRVLMGEPRHHPLVSGSGVEWVLQVPVERWQDWAGRLSFMLGSRWVPQGYGWVFPMEPGRLKVGVCRLHDSGRSQPPLYQLQLKLLDRLGLTGDTVVDRHGGLIRSTIRRREAHQRGALVGLGDAVSTGNLLGGEGIRHALTSADVLAPLLLGALAGRGRPLASYPNRLRQKLGWRWSLSGRLAQRTWLGLSGEPADRRLERLLEGLQTTASADALSRLLFDYRFERYGVRALPYLLGWASMATKKPPCRRGASDD